MNGLSNGNAKAISLDELTALNDEMAGLVRAGVPLEQGLGQFGREMPGRLQIVATELGQRLQSGQSLDAVLSGEGSPFPPVWRAVVLAGVRAGCLPAALESLSASGRKIAEMRRAVGAAFIYPLVVLSVAYTLFLFSVTRLIPGVAGAYEDLTRSSEHGLSWLVWLGAHVALWAAFPPLSVLAFLASGWYRSGKSVFRRGGIAAAQRRGAASSRSYGTTLGTPFWRRLPTIGRVLRDGRMATFAEILALLVRHQIPLHEALTLAGEATGDAGLGRAARATAERLQAGERLTAPTDVPAPLPPLVGWLILAGGNGAAATGAEAPFVRTLTMMAETYRQRAARAVTWAVAYLPILLTVSIGGAATLLQAAAVLGPVVRLLYRLAQA